MADPFVSLVPSASDPRVPAGFTVDQNGNIWNDGVTPISTLSRMDLNRLRALQFAAHRRSYDSTGAIGSAIDSWYRYGMNRERQINICVGSSWKILSAVGTTLELEAITGDARKVLESFWWEKEQVLNLYWVTGYEEHGSVSPGDMVVFSYPSAAWNQLRGRVEQILEATATTLKVRLDKAVDIADEVWLLDPETETPPAYLSCTIYTYGMREGQKWHYILNPIKFYGVRAVKSVTSAQLPANKIWRLENGAVASPASYDALDDPNFKLEGYDGEWHTIHEPTRLHTHHDLGTDVAIGTELPEGSTRTPFSDLTLTYTQFRVTYWRESDGAEPGCNDRGWYCFHSREDLSKSVGNITTDNGRVVEGTDHFYCDARVVDVTDETAEVDDYDRFAKAPGSDGIPDRVMPYDKFAEGKAAYRSKCIQYGYCSLMEEVYARGLSDRQAPATVDNKIGPALLEMVFSADIKLQQPYVLAQTQDAIRVGNPSFMYLNGYYGPLKTADGWHGRTGEWRGHGTWAEPEVVTDTVTGNQQIALKWGFERLFNHAALTVFDTEQTAFFPSVGTSYTTKRDPLNRAGTVDSDMLEILGGEVERDAGTLYGRGVNRSTLAIGEVTIELTDLPVESPTPVETWEASYVKPAGEDAVFTIKPLRQLAKTEESLGSRTVASQAWDAAKSAWKFQFDNTYKTFSRLDLGDLGTIGDSYDRLYTVACGGGPVIRPYEGQAINSIYTEVNRTGSRLAGLSPGDVMQVDGKRFVVIDAAPHAGDEAATWGNRRIVAKGWTSGFWEPSGLDEDRAPIVIDEIRNVTDSTVMTAVDQDEKPATLALDEFWFDGRQRVYFSSAANLKALEIDWTDAEELSATAFFTVQAFVILDFDIDYSEYTGATTSTVTIGGVTAAVIASGDPDPGEVKLENNGGKIRATFNIDDAANDSELRITLLFAVAADAPDNDWSHDNDFLAYGKKQDVCWCLEDQGHLDAVSTVGMEAEFFRSAAVWVPGSAIPEYKTTGDWTAIPTESRVTSGGAGTVTISNAWLTGLGAANYSVRVRGVKLFDHRGCLPASLLNKLEAMAARMNWVEAPFGSGFGVFTISKSIARNWGTGNLGWNGEACVPDNYDSGYQYGNADGYSGNILSYSMTAGAGYSAEAALKVSASSFGTPEVVKNIPDNCVIHQAIVVVTGGNLTRSFTYQTEPHVDCDGNTVEEGINPEGTPDTTIEEIAFTVIGFTSMDPNEFEIVGQISGGGNGSKVVDVTSIIQTMYDNRNVKKYVGFGVVYMPDGVDGDPGLEKYVKKGASRPVEVCITGTCYEEGDTIQQDYEYEYCTLTWDSIGLGTPYIRFDYDPAYMAAGFVQPSLPPFIPAPA